jgi:hypothetical protein
MYSSDSEFEQALRTFGTRVEVIIAMEMAGKVSPEGAYKEIRSLYKELKKIRKHDS